jgi:hypothetical protein
MLGKIYVNKWKEMQNFLGIMVCHLPFSSNPFCRKDYKLDKRFVIWIDFWANQFSYRKPTVNTPFIKITYQKKYRKLNVNHL